MSDRLGQQLGNYRLVRQLGKGGFAEVYLGEHIHLNTPAAIKVLHTQLNDQQMAEYFRIEARTIAQLVHPNIVRTLDFGIEGTIPFLVMDYASNGTLRSRYPKGTTVPLPTLVPYVKEMASALQYAHERKLVHRDVKPENMLIGRNDELLLSDFGIAIVAQTSRYQSTQDIAGTISYMAPEQIQAHPRPASDQYALAIVVYEWLSGRLPFEGTWTEIAVKQSTVPPEPLRDYAQVSPQVDAVVMRALEKDPTQRFSTIREFAFALEQAATTGQQGEAKMTYVRAGNQALFLHAWSSSTPGTPNDANQPALGQPSPQMFHSPPYPPQMQHLQQTSMPPYQRPDSYDAPDQPLYQYQQQRLYDPADQSPYQGMQDQPRARGEQAPNVRQERPNYFPLVRKGGAKDLLIVPGYVVLFLFVTYTLYRSIPDFRPALFAHTNLASDGLIWAALLFPLGSLLAGKLLGGIRGAFTMLLYVVGLLALAIFRFHTIFLSRFIGYELTPYLHYLGLAVAALAMGWFYEFRRTRSSTFAALTSLLGSLIVGVGMVGLRAVSLDFNIVLTYTLIGAFAVFVLEIMLHALAAAAHG
jgi:serine/threonine protein kinase